MSGSTQTMAPAVESTCAAASLQSQSTAEHFLLSSSPSQQPPPRLSLHSHTTSTASPAPSVCSAATAQPDNNTTRLPGSAAVDIPSIEFSFDHELDFSQFGNQFEPQKEEPPPVEEPRRIWQEFMSTDIDNAPSEPDIASTSTGICTSTDATTNTGASTSTSTNANDTADTTPEPAPDSYFNSSFAGDEPNTNAFFDPTDFSTIDPYPLKLAVETRTRRRRDLIDRPKSWLTSSRSTPDLRQLLAPNDIQDARLSLSDTSEEADSNETAYPVLEPAAQLDDSMRERPRTVSMSLVDLARRPWISRSSSPSAQRTSSPRPDSRKSISKKGEDGDESGFFGGRLSRNKRLIPTVVVVENSKVGADLAQEENRDENSSGSDASDSTIGPTDTTPTSSSSNGVSANGTVTGSTTQTAISSTSKAFSRASNYLTRMKQRPQSMFSRTGSTTGPSDSDRDDDEGTNKNKPLLRLPLDFLSDANPSTPGRNSLQAADSSGSSTDGSSANDSTALPASEAESQATADTSHHASPMAHHPTSRDPLWIAFKDLESNFFKFLSKANTEHRMSLVRMSLIPFLRRYALDCSNKDTALLSPEDVERRTSILNRWWTALLELLDSPYQWDACDRDHPPVATTGSHGSHGSHGNHGHHGSSSGGHTYFPTTTTVGGHLHPVSGADRPVVLEAVSMIMMRPEWRLLTPSFRPFADRQPTEPSLAPSNSSSAVDLQPPEDASFLVEESVEHNVRTTFVNNLTAQLALIVDKMAGRQVPASIVNFSGRACAYAFFFVPGVAEILVRLWGLDRSIDLVRRTADAFGILRRGNRNDTESIAALFPSSVSSLGWSTVNSTHAQLRQPPKMNLLLSTSVTCSRIPWFAPYWLSRWRGAETDLLFIFCKYYHRLLDEFMPSMLQLSLVEKARAPAFVLLHAQLLHIMDDTIHRQAAVEAAMMMAAIPAVDGNGGGPGAGTADAFVPPFLMQPMHNLLRDMDENRIIALLHDFLNADASVAGARNTFVLSLMSIMKAAACRTSQYDHNACCMLCDFLQETLQAFDGFFGYTGSGSGNSSTNGSIAAAPVVDYVDWRFWIDVCKMMLASNNTMSEIRVMSFIYAVWDIFAADPNRKEDICLNWLLTEEVFCKFFNNWCPMVRAYYMRLLCWRICRDTGNSDELDTKIFTVASQRLKTVWSHYLWLKQKAETENCLLPSTAPSLPQPGKRFMIVRTEVSGPQLGLLASNTRNDGSNGSNGSANGPATDFDALAQQLGGNGMDGASTFSIVNVASDEKKEGKKKWSLLGKVLGMSSSSKSDTEEQLEKTRRETAASRSAGGGLPRMRLGSASSDSDSSTGSAPVFDSTQFVFKFMLHNIPWQPQSGGLAGLPGGINLPPAFRDRFLTRPRLPAPAQTRINGRLSVPGKAEDRLPPQPRQSSMTSVRGLVSEARNANPSESVPVLPIGDNKRRGSSSGGGWENERCSSPLSRSVSADGEPEAEGGRDWTVVQPAQPNGNVAMQRAKYTGRALAEWTLVVNECNSFVERRRDEGVFGLKDVEVPSLGVEGMRRLG